ncbi:hypothetical protein S245_067286, partial [Arachis hypogaea]
KLSKNISEAIASLKNTLNIQNANTTRDPLFSSSFSTNSLKIEGSQNVVWGYVQFAVTEELQVTKNKRMNFTFLECGNINYAQANFDTKDVFFHIKLMKQALASDYPAILIQKEVMMMVMVVVVV